jgi:hypothetical protein
MDDLYPVAFLQQGLLPVAASNHLTVQLNRQAFRRERQMTDEFLQGDGIRHVSRLAVDLDKQRSSCFLQISGLVNDPSQFCLLPFDYGVDENGRSPGSEVRQHRVEGRSPVGSRLPRKNQRPEARSQDL